MIARRRSALKKANGIMEAALHRFDQDLADRLRRLVGADKWLAVAILFLLTREQWKLLRSQDVYHRVQQALEGAAHALIRRSGGHEDPEDVAQSALVKVMETDWLKRFDIAKGSPTGYLNGAMFHQTRDALRSCRRMKNAPVERLPEGTSDDGSNDPSRRVEAADELRWVLSVASTLPQDVHAALCRHLNEVFSDRD